jgi:hypothetical protein
VYAAMRVLADTTKQMAGSCGTETTSTLFTSRMVSAVSHSRPSQWILAWFAISSFVVFWVMLAAQCNE